MNVDLLSNLQAVTRKETKGYLGKSITETITNGFFTVDQKWTVTYWNKAAEKILGVKAADILGKNLWAEFADRIPLDFYAVYHKAFLQDIPLHFQEYWGEMGAWFDVITYHCNDTLSVSFKTPQHATVKNPVEQLEMLNELYKFVSEITNDCLWEWDLQTKEIFWIDGGHRRVFGYEIENALIPQSFWEGRVHPADRVRIIESINKVKESTKATLWEEEYRFQKADGNYCSVHDRGHIIYNDKNEACRMIGATQDITARKLTESQLLESERKLALIARQSINALIITDNKQKINWVNDSFTRITGYRPDEVIGRGLGSFLMGKDTDPLTLEILRKNIGEKKIFNCEIVNYSKAGRKYWMHVEGQPMLDENGNTDRYFVIQTDVTERVLLEEKLKQDGLLNQRKINAAVHTAHENERADIGKQLHENLNQILSAAKLFIERAKIDGENRQNYLDKSSAYILTVIDEINRISKSWSSPGIDLIGLFDSIKILLNDLQPSHQIKIDFQTNDIVKEDLDADQQLIIFRIVQEQLNNIIKHSKATYAIINLTRQLNDVTLLISDNGKGCDTSNEKNGLGLINIKSRVQVYGGTVSIQSKPGEGYELKVILPLKNKD